MSQPRKAAPFLVAISAAVGAVIGSAVVNQYFFRGRIGIDKALMQAANELNKTLPLMVDQETRLDSTTALPGKSFIYAYTLVNVTKDEIADVKSMKDEMRPRVVNQYRTNEGLKTFRNNHVTMHYQYSDKNGIFIADIVVGPGDL